MTPTKSNTCKPNICIIKKYACCKLSPAARGELCYHVGHDETAKTFLIRVTDNTGGGFFSNQWVSVDDIETAIESLNGEPFKATVFIPLYESSGANNHGFLVAALREEVILDKFEDQPLVHVIGDIKKFKAEMAKLVKAKTDLHDDIAEAEAIRDKKRAEMVERMRKASKEKTVKEKEDSK